MKKVYLDYNATTPLDLRVKQVIDRFLVNSYGNPSSLHWAGAEARKGIDEAHSIVAGSFGVSPDEIVFTSGGTESANLAIHGILGNLQKSGHVITSSVEHHAVLEPLQTLAQIGRIELSHLRVDTKGRLNPDDVVRLIREETALIAVMYANNETGNLFPIETIGRIARERKIPFFCDGVQVAGKRAINLGRLPVDLFSFSAHKFYGPKGVGGLYVRKGLKLKPLIEGGAQEMKRRGGTENVAGIIGLAQALKVSLEEMEREKARLKRLRDLLEERIRSIPGACIYGDLENRLENTTFAGFDRIDSETILIALDRHGIAASNGAACSSGTLEPSHVLMAMGFSEREAKGAVRFSVGRFTTEEEIHTVGEKLPEIVSHLR
ncbi:MAG: cysteine desulfurase [Deltaproteobacteria bacterium]|nr:cysteine desulfurase [Deltaproteobacteria bacterium]